MGKSAEKPVLVTGAHRSGTTWVGKMLAAGGEAAYISEPLNVLHRPGVFRARVDQWYTYICAENESQYLLPFQETLRLRYHPWLELRSLRSAHDAVRMGRDFATFVWGWLRRQRPLLKDPFAVFSIPWFIERLDCRVVVTLRSPMAFASSLVRLNWPFQMNDLLAQPLLMRDWLEPFRSQMDDLRQEPDDIVGQGALLWLLIYQAVEQLSRKYPPEQLQVVRHEDLSLDPLGGFRRLYASLGLNFNARAERMIREASGAENPGEVALDSAFSTRLDSRANLENWKKRLSVEQVERIRQLTEDIARRYYPDLTWN